MNISVKRLSPVWTPRGVAINFNNKAEYDIFRRIMRSDSHVAIFMSQIGFDPDKVQNVLDKISQAIEEAE